MAVQTWLQKKKEKEKKKKEMKTFKKVRHRGQQDI
jgi:hypothetical protein